MNYHYPSKPSEEYYFHEGCYIQELYNDPSSPDLSIARARVIPNTETKLHALSKTVERYVILSGNGVVTLKSKGASLKGDTQPALIEILVSVNDVIVIPADMGQKIRNTGQDDLVFLAICSPRFTEQVYTTVI